MNVGEVVTSTRDLRQGDVLNVPALPGLEAGAAVLHEAPAGVVIISQTCDVVQAGQSKRNVTVAPLLESPDGQIVSAARRGRSPLLLHLKGTEGSPEAIADLQRAGSLPKDALIGSQLIGRHTDGDSTVDARNLAQLVGRAYSRFAFPDAVHPVLEKMRRKARDTAGTASAFGRVIDHILELRITADQWDGPGRRLTLYAIVDARVLIFEEDVDPSWVASTSTINGLKPGEKLDLLSLTRVSELLADCCDSFDADAASANPTTILRLWEAWALCTKTQLLDSQTNAEVTEIDFLVQNDEEFTLAKWRHTASLDLEDLSDSTEATTVG